MAQVRWTPQTADDFEAIAEFFLLILLVMLSFLL
jgi:hypothetical protein